MEESALSDSSRVYTVQARFGVDPGRLVTCIVSLEVGAHSTVPIGFDNSLYSASFSRNGTQSKDLVVLPDVTFVITFEESNADVPVLAFWEMGASKKGAYVAGNIINLGSPLHVHSASKSRNIFAGHCTPTTGCQFAVGAIILRYQPSITHQPCSGDDMITTIKSGRQDYVLCAHRTTEPGVYDFTEGEELHKPLFSLWQDGNTTAELQLLTPIHNAVEQTVMSTLLLIVLLFFVKQTRLLSLVAARQCVRPDPLHNEPLRNKFKTLSIVPPDLLASAGVSVAYAAGASGQLNVPYQVEEVYGSYFRVVWGGQLASMAFASVATYIALRPRKSNNSTNLGESQKQTSLFLLARLAAESNLMIAAASFFPDEVGPDFKVMLGFFTGLISVIAASRDLVFGLFMGGPTGPCLAASVIQFLLIVHTVGFSLLFPAMYITPAVTNYKFTSSTLAAMLTIQSVFIGGIIAGRHLLNASRHVPAVSKAVVAQSFKQRF